MPLFDGKKGILRPKNGLVFKLRPQLTAFYLGPTPVSQFLPYHLSVMTLYGKRQGENHSSRCSLRYQRTVCNCGFRYCAPGDVIFSITCLRLKLAGFWLGGNSLKVCKNSPTYFCAGTIRNTRSSIQS